MAKNFEKEAKEIKEPSKEKIGEKIVEELYLEKKEELKKKEFLAKEEKIIREELEREVAKIKLSPELEKEAKKKAEKIKGLHEKEKLKRLLDIAEEKGLAFAIGIVRNMKDPYTLDIFHDILARDKLYKRFEK